MSAKKAEATIVEQPTPARKQLSGDDTDMLKSFVRRYDEAGLVAFVEELLNRGE